MTTLPMDDRLDAWTASQAAEVFSTLSIASPPPTQGRSVAIDIPLDDSIHHDTLQRTRTEAVHTVYKRREPIRRDSLKRREALLKGKEGSRRRQRWENDRLLSNPHAEPPLPSDWEVRPTYPVQRVPYFLAPLWDAEYAKVSERRAAAKTAAKPTGEAAAAQKVTQDLRAKLKRARGAKGLLQDLEMEVRGFVQQWDEKQRQLKAEGLIDMDSSEEDEEIVFVGRNGAMSDDKLSGKQRQALRRDKLIFESLVDDHGASFGRYLVHSIATYYGLKTWSVTTGNPARREAYVGLDDWHMHSLEMPQPLWLVV
ncbi:hypothetical protein AMS68_006755 [Peltaster fructicola]|uniref:R3H-associated N-terminal domain-containing protein n=1 Tax=Peltaster fructicola TaxID=286661 RepID=A0A6H0Y305_9PEZI|nr:hypothetical protein AMS68_006755 [Peltaster fructicola]